MEELGLECPLICHAPRSTARLLAGVRIVSILSSPSFRTVGTSEGESTETGLGGGMQYHGNVLFLEPSTERTGIYCISV